MYAPALVSIEGAVVVEAEHVVVGGVLERAPRRLDRIRLGHTIAAGDHTHPVRRNHPHFNGHPVDVSHHPPVSFTGELEKHHRECPQIVRAVEQVRQVEETDDGVLRVPRLELFVLLRPAQRLATDAVLDTTVLVDLGVGLPPVPTH